MPLTKLNVLWEDFVIFVALGLKGTKERRTRREGSDSFIFQIHSRSFNIFVCLLSLDLMFTPSL
jgi:hypothetical protein